MRPKSPEVSKKGEKSLWDAAKIFQNVSPLTSPSSSRASNSKKREKCIRRHPIRFMDINVIGNWTLKNIAMAGKLLRKPPIPVQFYDEDEMRKVYSLIYDVFRYKNVLSEALTDIGFFALYPQLKNDQSRVWLLLFELYVRHFLKRHPDETDLQDLIYREADLEDIANHLWEHRVRLAAAISRLRIKNGALQLSQLLPAHLKDEKVSLAVTNPVVSGWINPFKMKDISMAAAMLEKLGLTEALADEDGVEQPLQQCQYKWDKLCPLFISCIPRDRSKFSQSEMVKKNFFILQDKAFSVAPAILSRLLDYFELEGDVVQTHVSSPRSTAYLAALFYSVNRINNFLAFGAGNKLNDYKNFMKSLGISNVRLFSESFCKIPMESEVLDLAVGIFATPPNSFSGIADPIDLICSRGGDLNMLEALTESKISLDGKKRIVQLLDEQKETLRLALSRPHVQFVLYETYSIVGSENQDMVQKAVEDINQRTFERHLHIHNEKKKLEALDHFEKVSNRATSSPQGSPKRQPISAERRTRESIPKMMKNTLNRKQKFASRRSQLSSSGSSNISSTSNLNSQSSSKLSEADTVSIPDTEQFVVSGVPEFCLNEEKCVKFNSLGCYVSLLHRKQISKLDEKRLMKIAENKRLTGHSDRKRFFRIKSSKLDEKEDVKGKDDNSKSLRSKKAVASLIERLNRPTHASMNRSTAQNTLPANRRQHSSHDLMRATCTRHNHHHTDEHNSQGGSSAYMAALRLDPRAKRWWQETTHYINNLRLLERRKRRYKLQHGNDTSLQPLQLSYIDNRNSNIQRDSSRLRGGMISNTKPCPVTVNHLEFKGFEVLENGHMNFFNQPTKKSPSFQIAHRPIISRKPLGRYLLKDSQLVLSY